MLRNRHLKHLLIAGIYLALWQVAALLVRQTLLLPGPVDTLVRFFQLALVPESWRIAGLSLVRIMAGYLMGVMLGTLLALLCARFSFARDLLNPLKSIVKATPVTSFILLALLWLTSDLVPVAIALLMVMPIVWTNLLEAILETDGQLIEMARVYRFSSWKRVRYIYMPSVAPQFYAACTTALGFAWKSGVAAEIIALPKASIGYQLYQSKLQLETVDLFAWTLLVILLSMLLEYLLKRLMGRIRHD